MIKFTVFRSLRQIAQCFHLPLLIGSHSGLTEEPIVYPKALATDIQFSIRYLGTVEDIEMKTRESTIYKHVISFTFLTIISLPALCEASDDMFTLIYTEIPGIEAIRSGNGNAAVRTLERSTLDTNENYAVDALSTLCALYIAKGKLSAASVTCNKAVEIDQSAAAFNNRGIFRAQIGDINGALEDFARAKESPSRQTRDANRHIGGDPHLTASRNFAVARKYTGNQSGENIQSAVVRPRGASIEDLKN